jgi:co-chaperonin GroES (HSP10)
MNKPNYECPFTPEQLKQIRDSSRPVGDNYAIVPQEIHRETEGGIVLPDSVQEEGLKLGLVIHVGRGVYSHQGGTFKPIEAPVGHWVQYQDGPSLRRGPKPLITETRYFGVKVLLITEELVYDVHADPGMLE